MDVGQLVSDYGFPAVMAVGLGYFIYYIWWYIGEHIEPQLQEMHIALIRVIDQTRMLDQDLIRLKEKVNVVLEYKAQEKMKNEAKDEEE